MKEIYQKWEPIKGIEDEMWVEALHDDYEGLRIILRGGNPSSAVLRISFEKYYIYRNADESYRLKLWEFGNFEEQKWPLFYTKSSSLIDWLFDESDGVYEKDQMLHYLVKTGADIIEIVAHAKTSPKVKWLNTPDSKRVVSDSTLIKRGKRGGYYNKDLKK